MLGHASSAAMTLDIYSGLFADDLEAVADQLDRAFARTNADHMRTNRCLNRQSQARPSLRKAARTGGWPGQRLWSRLGDLRIMSCKRASMEWSARVSGVCDCAKATMIGQFVGCSLGCSDCHAWEGIPVGHCAGR